VRKDFEVNSKIFLEQYTPAFVGRWDELINWENRRRSENGFFERILSEAGASKILDIACGTGYHTINLSLSGFDVIGADGSATMIAQAKENAEQQGLKDIRFEEAEWTALSRSFPDGDQFGAIICLGNAFTHLFEQEDRKKALKEIFALLNPGGIAIIDQRNYDTLLDKGYSSKHEHYYLGDTVEVWPTSVHEEVVELAYHYSDGEIHNLTLFPIRQAHLTNLLNDAGFESVVRYGDFEEKYSQYEPDFIVQVARRPRSRNCVKCD